MAIASLSPASTAPPPRRSDRREPVSFARLLWLGPLTVALALGVNYFLKLVLQAFDASLAHMGQLQAPMVSLTLQGAVAGVLVFAAMAAVLRRPIFWYRVVASVALLVSLVPDIALGVGGSAAMFGMRLMQPFLSLGMPTPTAAAGAGGPPSGAPAGGMPATSVEHVLVLILLHVATFVVCVGLLTTLTRGSVRRVTDEVVVEAVA